MTTDSNPINERLARLLDPAGPTWRRKPKVRTAPEHHFCAVIERGDVEEEMHSSTIDIIGDGMKLDGKRNKTRLAQILAVGPGRWVLGGRQPAEVKVDQLVYVKERTTPFKMHFRGENYFYIAMDAVLATLDEVNLKLIPLGQYIVTVHNEERERQAVTEGKLFLPGAPALDVDKRGAQADDIGCNTRRIEEVVAVGPGKFGGFMPKLTHGEFSELKLEMVPYWETPSVKVGDLVVFTDMARPTNIHVGGRNYTVIDGEHSVCRVLDF